MGRDILGGHDAAGRLDGPRDLGADQPAVIGLAPTVRQRSQGCGQQRLAEAVARTTGDAEHGSRVRIEPLERRRDGPSVDRRQGIAVIGDLRGGENGIGQ